MATIKQLNSYKNIIIKIGSSLIVDESGSIREEWLNSLVQDIANLKKNSKNVIIVTSRELLPLVRKYPKSKKE